MEFFEKFLTNVHDSKAFRAAMYTLKNAGKRVRPRLVFETAALFDVFDENIERIACAAELIHTYSLIHDDLPCMDDDDFRRGKPSCHKAFGEGDAVLAGDGLLNLSMEICTAGKPCENYFKALNRLYSCTGFNGMIKGQSSDIDNGKPKSKETLTFLTENKTAKLFEGAVMSAAEYCGASEEHKKALETFVYDFGFAFQIKDDILDDGTEPDKLTFTSVYGAKAYELLNEFSAGATKSIGIFGEKAAFFTGLVDKNLKR